jgi:hypothetical protein
MTKPISAQSLVKKVRRRDNVLLINPPVEETRYSWVRWNQPLDLLKIASFLRSHQGCAVRLLDFMKPNNKGEVPEEWLPKDRRYYAVGEHRYPMRHFGKPFNYLSAWIEEERKRGGKNPTQIWITSLCSFWHESVAEMCRVARQTLPDATIVLTGQYPRYLPKHAAVSCAADFTLTKSIHVENEPAALDLYGNEPPPFLAVQPQSESAIQDIRAAFERGILDMAFFEDDCFLRGDESIRAIIEATENLHRHLRYHFLCGVHPERVNRSVAEVLAHPKVAQVHFEEAGTIDALNLDAYRQARELLQEAGLKLPSDRVSGFVWIGRPKEQLEKLILKSFQVLDILGNLILKPFSPTPGSREHKEHEKYLDRIPVREWSPHFFPFSELNGIAHDEYHDLYRMAAFLNEKVRDRSFDFLKGTLGTEMLRESLRKEVWNLEPSPLRLVD